jgi:hypothetical protein
MKPLEESTIMADGRISESVWTDGAIARLGTVPDKQLASELGTNTTSVFRERTKRNIAAYIPRPNWTKDVLAMLGTVKDRIVAEKLGFDVKIISKKRRSLGIPPLTPVVGPVTIPKDLEAKLGKVSDAIIAKELGVSAPTISKRRRELRIQPIIVHAVVPPELDAWLGKISDTEIASQFGVTRSCVQSRRSERGIPRAPQELPAQPTLLPIIPEPVIEKLGQQPDKQLADEARLPVFVIFDARVRLGIAQYRAGGLPAEAISKLGIVADNHIASEYGLSTSRVRRERTARGIARA